MDMLKCLGLSLVLLLLFLSFVRAEQIGEQTKDLAISYNAGIPLYVGKDYDSLFRVRNLDHKTGQQDDISVNIYYTISADDVLLQENTSLIEHLNSFSTKDTGFFLPPYTGVFEICGVLFNASFPDNNTENNRVCADVDVIDTRNIPCNVSLSLSISNTLFQAGEKVQFLPEVNDETFPYTIEYWIEDLYGNLRKNRINSSLSTQKSWTPDEGIGAEPLLIKARITDVACNDTSTQDNSAEQMFAVKGFYSDDPSLTIDEVHLGNDGSVKFGESFSVDISAYTGSSTKTAISAWLEDGEEKITDTAKSNVRNGHTLYHFSLPLRADANCEGKLPEKTYTLVVLGLDLEQRQDVLVRGITKSSCPESKATAAIEGIPASPRVRTPVYAEISSFPGFLFFGSNASVEVLVMNRDEVDHTLEIYSYFYKNSVSYSGEREGNKQFILLEPQSQRFITLPTPLLLPKKASSSSSSSSQQVNLKVKYKDESRSTYHEITKNLTVGYEKASVPLAGDASLSLASTDSVSLSLTAQKQKLSDSSVHEARPEEQQPLTELSGSAVTKVYSSSQKRAKELIPYLFCLVAGLLSVFFVFKNRLFP